MFGTKAPERWQPLAEPVPFDVPAKVHGGWAVIRVVALGVPAGGRKAEERAGIAAARLIDAVLADAIRSQQLERTPQMQAAARVAGEAGGDFLGGRAPGLTIVWGGVTLPATDQHAPPSRLEGAIIIGSTADGEPMPVGHVYTASTATPPTCWRELARASGGNGSPERFGTTLIALREPALALLRARDRLLQGHPIAESIRGRAA